MNLLKDNYSTTKLCVKEYINTSIIFLPENDTRRIENGLRTKGYFKNSFKNKPLITIITVTYNSELFLEETIKSVLNQTYENIEYIIIDGGSTDKTLDILKKYENAIDYFISEPDKGMYDALNKGFSVATGKLINFCNSDDVFYSNNVIENIVKNYNKENFDCCYGYAEFTDANNKHLSYHYSLPFKKRYIVTLGSFFIQPTFFWTKDIMQKSGLFNLEYKIASDRDFIGRILLISNNVARIDSILVKFRKHGESFGDKNSEIASRETLSIKNIFLLKMGINKKLAPLYEYYDRLNQKLYRIYKTFMEK